MSALVCDARQRALLGGPGQRGHSSAITPDLWPAGVSRLRDSGAARCTRPFRCRSARQSVWAPSGGVPSRLTTVLRPEKCLPSDPVGARLLFARQVAACIFITSRKWRWSGARSMLRNCAVSSGSRRNVTKRGVHGTREWAEHCPAGSGAELFQHGYIKSSAIYICRLSNHVLIK